MIRQTYTLKKNISALKNTASRKNLNASIVKQIKPLSNALQIDNFEIRHLSIYWGAAPSESYSNTKIQNFNADFSKVRIDSSWAQHHPLLPSKIFYGSAESLRWGKSQFYHFKTANIWFSSKDSSIIVKSIALEPKIPRYEFSHTAGHETDRITLHIPSVIFQGLNFNTLIRDRRWVVQNIRLKDSKLEVFRNKIPPAGPAKKHIFPQLLFQRMELPISVDTVTISNADITYSEQENLIPEPGTVTFENTNATLRNLHNHLRSNSTSKPIIMRASSDVLGSGHLTARFTFPYNNSGTHYISGSFGSLPMKKLNQTTKNLGAVQIESGQIHSMNFDMELGPTESTGSLNMNYSNLKIKILEFDETKKQNPKQFQSLLANTFVIKKNNKPPLRTGTISFERNPEKSIFNYWWKSLLSGLKSSIGL